MNRVASFVCRLRSPAMLTTPSSPATTRTPYRRRRSAAATIAGSTARPAIFRSIARTQVEEWLEHDDGARARVAPQPRSPVDRAADDADHEQGEHQHDPPSAEDAEEPRADRTAPPSADRSAVPRFDAVPPSVHVRQFCGVSGRDRRRAATGNCRTMAPMVPAMAIPEMSSTANRTLVKRPQARAPTIAGNRDGDDVGDPGSDTERWGSEVMSGPGPRHAWRDGAR